MKAVVCYSLAKCLSQFTDNRNGLLLKSSFITEEVARALTDHGYKYLSHFGYACPVQVRLMSGNILGMHVCIVLALLFLNTGQLLLTFHSSVTFS